MDAVIAAALAVVGGLAGWRLGALEGEAAAEIDQRLVVPAAGLAVPLVFFGIWPDAPVVAMVVALGVAPLVVLAAIDAATRRLPNRWTRPLTAFAIAGVVAVALAEGDPKRALGAAVSGAVLTVFYLALALLGKGRGMGLGDVKLALPLGLLTGLVSPALTLAGTMLAFVLGAGYGLWLMLVAREGRKATMPFGPFMVAGALTPLAVRGISSLVP